MKGDAMKKQYNKKMVEDKYMGKANQSRLIKKKNNTGYTRRNDRISRAVVKKISVGILSTALVSSNVLGTLSLANVTEIAETNKIAIEKAYKANPDLINGINNDMATINENEITSSINEEMSNSSNGEMATRLNQETPNRSNLNIQKDIRWVRGITPPITSDFKIIPDGYYTFYTVADKVGTGWFDANKKRGTQDDAILCSAAVSANMLHWWLEQNSDNVSRFLEINKNPEKRNLAGMEIKPLKDLVNSYNNQDDSEIFKVFTDYFGSKNGQESRTVWADTVTDMFINGYNPNLSGNVNDESKYNENTLDKRGGYFKEVFGKKILTSRTHANKKQQFNEKLKTYLNEGKAIGLSYYNGGRMGHIINVWGAEFDEKGDAVAVYVTDSDDQSSTYKELGDKKRGLFRYRVVYGYDGETRISALTNPEPRYGGKVIDLYGLSLGEEQWNKYFEKIEKEKANKVDKTEKVIEVEPNIPIGREKKDPLSGEKDEAKAELKVTYDRIIAALNNGSDYADLEDKGEIIKKLDEIFKKTKDSIDKSVEKKEIVKFKDAGLISLQKENAKADLKLIATKQKGEIAELPEAEEGEITNANKEIDRVLKEQISNIDATSSQVELNKEQEKAKALIPETGKAEKRKIEDRISKDNKKDESNKKDLDKKDEPNKKGPDKKNEQKKEEPKDNKKPGVDNPKKETNEKSENAKEIKDNEKRALEETKRKVKEDLQAKHDEIVNALDNGSDYFYITDRKPEIKQSLKKKLSDSSKDIDGAADKSHIYKAREKGLVELQKEQGKADVYLTAAKKKVEIAGTQGYEQDDVSEANRVIDSATKKAIEKIDGATNQQELIKATDDGMKTIKKTAESEKFKLDKKVKDNNLEDKQELTNARNDAYAQIKAAGEKKKEAVEKMKDVDAKRKANQKLADSVDRAYKEVDAADTPENVKKATEQGIAAINGIDTKDKVEGENPKKDNPKKDNPKKEDPKKEDPKDNKKPSPGSSGGSSGGTSTLKKDNTGSSINSSSKIADKNTDKKNMTRISGKSRIETAIEISKKIYKESSDTAILANKDSYPDVLSAVPFAKQLGAPILLTNEKSTPKEVINEFKRLNVKKVIIVGGQGAIKDIQEKELKKEFDIERIGGSNRYETSLIIAEKMMKNGSKSIVEVASGEIFADALSMSMMATADNAPIILLNSNSLSPSAKSFLEKYSPKAVNVAGGESSVSMGIYNELKNLNSKPVVKRFSGKDRFETSTVIAKASKVSNKTAVYTSGEIFADALVSGPYAASKNAPLLLVKKNTLPKAVENFSREKNIKSAEIVGGESQVSEVVKSAISNI